MRKKKKWIKYVVAIIVILCLGTSVFILNRKVEVKTPEYEMIEDDDFTINLLKKTYKEGNYLISPYSIKVALNMLKEGASGETKKEIEKVLNDTLVNNVENVKIANGIFIKELYKEVIESSFTNTLSSKYSSEILYDEFNSPLLINEWTREKTDGMINKVIDEISPDFVLGLINAITLDAKWQIPFACTDTQSESFTTESGNKLNVEMMHNTFQDTVKYYDDSIAKGVMIPYDGNLEFIAILPNNIDKFMSQLTKKKLDKILSSFKLASEDERVNLSLPRFKYEYEINEFINLLKDMGIKKVFSLYEADFSNIIAKENLKLLESENIYINRAVHKTYIDLNEERTRAAAATFFGFDKEMSAIEQNYKEIDIKFNKTFIYMIRDKKTNEIVFFGQVNEPNIYEGSTCIIR